MTPDVRPVQERVASVQAVGTAILCMFLFFPECAVCCTRSPGHVCCAMSWVTHLCHHDGFVCVHGGAGIGQLCRRPTGRSTSQSFARIRDPGRGDRRVLPVAALSDRPRPADLCRDLPQYADFVLHVQPAAVFILWPAAFGAVHLYGGHASGPDPLFCSLTRSSRPVGGDALRHQHVRRGRGDGGDRFPDPAGIWCEENDLSGLSAQLCCLRCGATPSRRSSTSAVPSRSSRILSRPS